MLIVSVVIFVALLMYVLTGHGNDYGDGCLVYPSLVASLIFVLCEYEIYTGQNGFVLLFGVCAVIFVIYMMTKKQTKKQETTFKKDVQKSEKFIEIVNAFERDKNDIYRVVRTYDLISIYKSHLGFQDFIDFHIEGSKSSSPKKNDEGDIIMQAIAEKMKANKPIAISYLLGTISEIKYKE